MVRNAVLAALCGLTCLLLTWPAVAQEEADAGDDLPVETISDAAEGVPEGTLTDLAPATLRRAPAATPSEPSCRELSIAGGPRVMDLADRVMLTGNGFQPGAAIRGSYLGLHASGELRTEERVDEFCRARLIFAAGPDVGPGDYTVTIGGTAYDGTDAQVSVSVTINEPPQPTPTRVPDPPPPVSTPTPEPDLCERPPSMQVYQAARRGYVSVEASGFEPGGAVNFWLVPYREAGGTSEVAVVRPSRVADVTLIASQRCAVQEELATYISDAGNYAVIVVGPRYRRGSEVLMFRVFQFSATGP